MGTITVGAKTVAVRVRTRDWMQTGLRFIALPTRKETRTVTVHWTGGTNLASGVFETLVTRNLSVHFCIDPDGTITQFCNTDRRCAHAGRLDDSNLDGHQLSANEFSIGIEVVNPANATRRMKGVTREVVRETIHDEELAASCFTSEQNASVLELVEVLCREYGLPMVVPMEGGDVITRVMTEPEYQAFHGVVGHYMLTIEKRDPGLAIMRAIAAKPLRGRDGAAE